MNAVPVDTGVANFGFLLYFLQIGEWTMEQIHHVTNQASQSAQCSMNYAINIFFFCKITHLRTKEQQSQRGVGGVGWGVAQAPHPQELHENQTKGQRSLKILALVSSHVYFICYVMLQIFHIMNYM